MKNFLIVLVCLPLLITATTYNYDTPPMPEKDLDDGVYKLMEVASLWNLLNYEYEPNRDRDATWLDAGLRSKYGTAKLYASLEMMEGAFGVPVFVSGPHTEHMNFNSQTSFGHYNPEFINLLTTKVKMVLEEPMFKKVLKNLYDQHFSSLLLTYKDAYSFVHSDPSLFDDIQGDYNGLINDPKGTSEGSLQEEFRDYADKRYFTPEVRKLAQKTASPKGDWYEKVTAPAFWIRRSIDGTDKAILDLLDLVITEMNS